MEVYLFVFIVVTVLLQACTSYDTSDPNSSSKEENWKTSRRSGRPSQIQIWGEFSQIFSVCPGEARLPNLREGFHDPLPAFQIKYNCIRHSTIPTCLTRNKPERGEPNPIPHPSQAQAGPRSQNPRPSETGQQSTRGGSIQSCCPERE
ncbi:hypothetical protein PGT21_000514 [Puccinia graminis f. sp. tritici]|uniref:Secreted protein n=1 Tax=Puccinia graminis f. sp. tritici TaxID=56615 RepID=A0A5B0MI27_PUCGR|nr:hypothetical protein PGT21_000514 [Puccinia graminis f. sp. tritici]